MEKTTKEESNAKDNQVDDENVVAKNQPEGGNGSGESDQEKHVSEEEKEFELSDENPIKGNEKVFIKEATEVEIVETTEVTVEESEKESLRQRMIVLIQTLRRMLKRCLGLARRMRLLMMKR